VQLNSNARSEAVMAEIVSIRAELTALTEQLATIPAREEAAEDDSGVIEAMLALQERMNTLETEWAERPAPAAAAAPGTAGYSSTDGEASVNPDWPTENCIPIGTRFMASVGDELAICESPVVVKLSAVTDDNVMVENTGLITETAFKTIPGSNCQLSVIAADGEGFAELRVSCN
jgi:hypothetical protein